jgi:hypothetical protein
MVGAIDWSLRSTSACAFWTAMHHHLLPHKPQLDALGREAVVDEVPLRSCFPRTCLRSGASRSSGSGCALRDSPRGPPPPFPTSKLHPQENATPPSKDVPRWTRECRRRRRFGLPFRARGSISSTRNSRLTISGIALQTFRRLPSKKSVAQSSQTARILKHS